MTVAGPPPTLAFLGATGTVTGSKYLLRAGAEQVLFDCGLFQGLKVLRERNWAPPPLVPRELAAVVLTHAHIDHSGYLPVLARNGFSGPVYCAPATADLCAILLPDSGFLQERDAEFANLRGFSKHKPALPLYTRAEAEACLRLLRPVPFGATQRIGAGVAVKLLPAGHIPGASILEVTAGGVTTVFSGDLGRPGDPTMVDPVRIERADYLLVESTYGDRRHDPADAQDALAAIIRRTAARGGIVLVPAFAVGRTQSILYHLHALKVAGRIPNVPVFVDSPMAIDATQVYLHHADSHRMTPEQCRAAFSVARYVQDATASEALTADPTPKVLISASGMATGGRVLHHLKQLVTDRRNTIVFAGFQAAGTRGAAMLAGAQTIKMHGQEFPVRAEIANLEMLSAHADADEMMAWLRGFAHPPRTTFIVHGEPVAADVLRRRIQDELGWHARVPEYRDSVALGVD